MAKTRSMTRNQNHDDDASNKKKIKTCIFCVGMVKKRNRNHNDASSKKKRINKTCDTWSDLNHDVLNLVMMQLGFSDYVSFSRVCKSWRSLAVHNKNKFIESRLPMSLSIPTYDDDDDDDEKKCHLEDFEGRKFKFILPHSAGRICIGVTCGYMILCVKGDFNENRDFWLVNPITRHELHFPDYPFFLTANEEEMRAILVFSPSTSQWVFVILHRLIRIISFSIAGKRGWNHVSCTHPIHSTLAIVDLHAFKGKIYTLQSDCSLGELRLDPNQEGKWTLLETNNFSKPDLLHLELVSSGENLYVISRISALNKVLELDFVKMKWVKPEKIIREYAFFHSRLKSSAAIKRTQYKSYDYFNDTVERQQRMLFYATMWYFPHDCLNVNLLDE